MTYQLKKPPVTTGGFLFGLNLASLKFNSIDMDRATAGLNEQ